MYSNEEQLYNSEPVKSDEIYANIVQEQRVANILGQTSPDNQLIDIEWRIRGYRKNGLTGQWEKIKDTKEPNPMLIGRYMSFLGSILNDNTRFTNLNSMQINNIMRLCIEYLADDMDTNSKEYGFEFDYTERERIGLIILNQTFFVMKRSENGMESKRVWNALSLSEVNNPLQQKKGFLDNLKFWNK